MKVNRKIIEIDEERCDGCGNCVPSCAEGALQIIDGKAKLVADLYCDGLGACLGECPTGALSVIEREAEEFDEEAVEGFLNSKEKEAAKTEETLACGCPSSQIQTLKPSAACEEANQPIRAQGAGSALSHWPVQIRLVPPTAPFLKGADLLVVSDCAPVVYPNFQRDFVEGRVVMVGCPKFDDAPEYIEKFADIFKVADIKSVTVLVMEVPCCQGMPVIVEKGMEAANKKIPVEKVVVGVKGDIIGREKQAA
jgi:NAD-dependent dihydropyrimidine dehydrogenase PreA subunit